MSKWFKLMTAITLGIFCGNALWLLFLRLIAWADRLASALIIFK